MSLNGDVDIDSVFAASLPTSHPSFAPQRHLDMSNRWKAPPLLDQPVDMFIGILSAGNHFAERMAIRRSWMQHQLIRSSNVVARFFVALVGCYIGSLWTLLQISFAINIGIRSVKMFKLGMYFDSTQERR